MAKETKFDIHSTNNPNNINGAINANNNNNKQTSYLSFLPEFHIMNEYDTFLEIKETKNKSPILIYNEKALKTHIKEMKNKYISSIFQLYWIFSIELLIQLFLSFYFSQNKKFNSYLSHFCFLILNSVISFTTIFFSNMYTHTLLECVVCFIIAMDIWLAGISFEFIFYISELTLNYYMITKIIQMKDDIIKIEL